MLKAVFFDLDGTLLPMDEEKFTNVYFELICKKLSKYGYDPNELVNNIWSCTKAMYLNDGNNTNEKVFWSSFSKLYNKDVFLDMKIFEDFYHNEFKEIKKYCFSNQHAKKIIDYCNKNLDYVVLSTNPIFPSIATETRMSFIGLSNADFDYVTTYENSCFTKPNPKYFLSLLDKFNLKPNEVILFGNNTLEDGDCAYKCGIKCYLVGDYIINNPKSNGNYERIRFDQVIDKINYEINIRK